MKLENERKETFYAFDFDANEKEMGFLKEYALKHIVNDDKVLINYAVNRILEEQVATCLTQKKDDVLLKLPKIKKNRKVKNEDN